MALPACQWTSLRPFVFGSLVALCFLGLFFTYYQPDFRFPSIGLYLGKGQQVCPNVCAEGAKTQNPNSSTELQISPNPSDAQKIAEVDTEPDTIVLIWMWPFGQRFDVNCGVYNITKCHLTNDKTVYHKAHGVLFHHRDIHGNGGNMPQEPRPLFQKWVWFNMESPANSGRMPYLDRLVNLTCNYRLDSSIPVPYGYLEPLTSVDESFKLPAKDKLVCWIVSNWNARYKRVEYYNELKKHIEINAYGNAFAKGVSDKEYSKIVSSCKFYLSFENSIFKDYITEKLYLPMMKGSVPVVLGPPRQNYEDHIPPGSFIHIDDFSSPKELAERLRYLDQHESEYMSYFDWTRSYKVKRAAFGKEHACRTCRYLQHHKEYQSFHDLNKWYWG